MGTSSMNGEFSSRPCLITRGTFKGDHLEIMEFRCQFKLLLGASAHVRLPCEAQVHGISKTWSDGWHSTSLYGPGMGHWCRLRIEIWSIPPLFYPSLAVYERRSFCMYLVSADLAKNVEVDLSFFCEGFWLFCVRDHHQGFMIIAIDTITTIRFCCACKS
jgi:hypothetical protein